MSYENALLSKWETGRATIGSWLTVPHPIAAEAMLPSGLDWAAIDLQHGAFENSDLAAIIPAILARGVAPLARVADNDFTAIGRSLDMGADGVIVPLIEGPEDAAAAVAACRFPPNGSRSYGPSRFGILNATWDHRDVERVACILMVETRAGVDNIEAIAQTPGVDALLIGPSDLAISLGVPPHETHESPTVADAISRVHRVATEAGLVSGMVAPSGALARKYLDIGFRMVTIASDLSLILSGIASELNECGIAPAAEA